MALDWWNGNRSVRVDADLTGLMMGMTLRTRPEEMYRALIEATAYGTRVIIENFRKHGVPVDALYAAGGIAQKNKLMMQIYADVTGMEIRLGASAQAPAVGSAMFGAVAAGAGGRGYDSISDAARRMGGCFGGLSSQRGPCRRYRRLYDEYLLLHDASDGERTAG